MSYSTKPNIRKYLLADASKAKKKLSWEPKVTFEELVKIMVDADMELTGISTPGNGKKILENNGIHWTNNHVTKGQC